MNEQRKRIMIVDDSDIDREILKNILETEYDIYEETNGYDALEHVIEDKINVDAVMLDISMPIFDGFAVLEIMKNNNIKNIPIIMITSEATKENVFKAVQFGVNEFIRKPFDPQFTLNRLRTIFNMPPIEKLEITEEQNDESCEVLSSRDVEKTHEYIDKLKRLFNDFFENRTFEDEESMNEQHYIRVEHIMNLLVKQYSTENPKLKLTKEHVKIISAAAYLHDFGMITMPDECILEEKCTGTSLNIYYKHTSIGSKIIKFNSSPACKFFVDICSEICLNHHEYWDGSGFPKKQIGIKDNGTIFPNLCTLTADFDKKFIKRKSYDINQFNFIMNEINLSGKKYNPEAIKLFEKCKNAIIVIYKKFENGLI